MDRLRELIVRACSNRGADELSDEYNKVFSGSPYQETIWGTSSHETMMRDRKCEVANAHVDLNRFSNILPFDEHLAPCSKGYINASVVRPLGRQFLIAQGPMSDPDTREAFWYTVLEHNVQLMVNLAPFGQECADYLTAGAFGDARVNITSEERSSNTIVFRTLEVSAPGVPPRIVRHVQFDDWPNYSMPYDSTALATVAKYVLDHRAAAAAAASGEPSGATLVNCSGGVGRSGTLVATLALWEDLSTSAQSGQLDAELQEAAAAAETSAPPPPPPPSVADSTAASSQPGEPAHVPAQAQVQTQAQALAQPASLAKSVAPVAEDDQARAMKNIVVGRAIKAVEAVREHRHPWLVEGFGQYALIFEVLRILGSGTTSTPPDGSAT